MKKYETPDYIKQELSSLLSWFHKKQKADEEKNFSSEKIDFDEAVNEYLTEKDICLHGDLRKLHGANTRNATFELWMGICSALLGLGLVILFIYWTK